VNTQTAFSPSSVAADLSARASFRPAVHSLAQNFCAIIDGMHATQRDSGPPRQPAFIPHRGTVRAAHNSQLRHKTLEPKGEAQ